MQKILKGKIIKTWSSTGNRMYQQRVAYFDRDDNLQTTWLSGRTIKEVNCKVSDLKKALNEQEK